MFLNSLEGLNVFQADIPKLPMGKYAHIITLRETNSFALFQTDGELNISRVSLGHHDVTWPFVDHAGRAIRGIHRLNKRFESRLSWAARHKSSPLPPIPAGDRWCRRIWNAGLWPAAGGTPAFRGYSSLIWISSPTVRTG